MFFPVKVSTGRQENRQDIGEQEVTKVVKVVDKLASISDFLNPFMPSTR